MVLKPKLYCIWICIFSQVFFFLLSSFLSIFLSFRTGSCLLNTKAVSPSGTSESQLIWHWRSESDMLEQVKWLKTNVYIKHGTCLFCKSHNLVGSRWVIKSIIIHPNTTIKTLQTSCAGSGSILDSLCFEYILFSNI